MKKLFKSFLILSAIAMAIPCFAQTPNTLTKKEKKAGWELLFNGKDFSGWRQCNGTAMPANWVIEDNAMKVFTGEGKKPGQGANGDILYQKEIQKLRALGRLESEQDGKLRYLLLCTRGTR